MPRVIKCHESRWPKAKVRPGPQGWHAMSFSRFDCHATNTCKLPQNADFCLCCSLSVIDVACLPLSPAGCLCHPDMGRAHSWIRHGAMMFEAIGPSLDRPQQPSILAAMPMAFIVLRLASSILRASLLCMSSFCRCCLRNLSMRLSSLRCRSHARACTFMHTHINMHVRIRTYMHVCMRICDCNGTQADPPTFAHMRRVLRRAK